GLAAKLASPDRPLVVLSGDGGMQMTGMAELITVSRLWKNWKNPVFAICVLNNRDLAEVSWEQRETETEPRFDDSQDIPDVDYSGYARLLGLDGVRVENPDDVGPAWDRALSADRPFVLDIRTDADVPLLPPFPGGQELAQSMEMALETEGNNHALELLREYVRLEIEAQL
uniref:thiamine pyrophosphate-dependent enzyme n=1 Tax=Arthrobacter sp. TaxID=1667 RepID=UPI00281167D9